MNINEKFHILETQVPEDVLSRLFEPESTAKPTIPFVWMLTYRAESALHNIRYFENGARHCNLAWPIRVYLSEWTAAIVISFVPLAAIREPHILEWFVTFKEIALGDAKARLTRYPDFPYDGRQPDALMAEHITSGGVQAMLKKSREALRERNIPEMVV